ncbi:MAG TPA: bifunctional adenosylcobinamide kinase/adenosylcobinamide-phosphate guanylyltransferase [Steroidobacteraceae bacterium]|nr:bifunctional adenosylcobinamide kinase/adenosylcobinamide-phosphate guanylyltransferase [Steroidobacteraceae bacterium]
MSVAPTAWKALILGGVRSGKSRHADALARAQGRAVTVIATGVAQDEEMAARIEAHRNSRSPEWNVIEEPIRLAAALRAAAASQDVVIVDCLTLWLSNLLCGDDPDALRRESAALLDTLATLGTPCIMVSNEVGLGIIPASALARRFGDEAGVLHQRVAALCDRVILMLAGLPLAIKGPGAAAGTAPSPPRAP